MAALQTSKYWGPIKWLGGIAIILAVVGFLLAQIIPTLPVETQRVVIIQSLPFVGIFVAILLIFILIIVMVAMRLNLKVPHRTQRAIELTIIAMIIGSIIALFQSWNIVGYNYGFVMLVLSTLGYILWSHIVPRNPDEDAVLGGFQQRSNIVGAVVAAVVMLLLVYSLATGATPQEPYGERQRQWDRWDEDQQAEVRDAAWADYYAASVPFFVLYAVAPGLIVFFGVREYMETGRKEME